MIRMALSATVAVGAGKVGGGSGSRLPAVLMMAMVPAAAANRTIAAAISRQGRHQGFRAGDSVGRTGALTRSWRIGSAITTTGSGATIAFPFTDRKSVV